MPRSVRLDGVVLCWGDPRHGQLGSKDPRIARTTIDSFQTVSLPASTKAEPVLGIAGAKDLAVGGEFACALTGVDVQCWGSNKTGQLGRGSFGAKAFPIGSIPPSPQTVLSNAVQVALGDSHGCALLSSGEVHCWGRNDERQLVVEPTEFCERGTGCATRPVRALVAAAQ